MGRLADPPSLAGHAAENLQFIRDTMARASGFTAVPGLGGMVMGVTAIAVAIAATSIDDSRTWLALWLVEAAVAVTIGVVAVARKARRTNTSLVGAPTRQFALAYLPALAAGAMLTAVFVSEGLTRRLPGCWLLCYGAAVSSAGAFSVRPVPLLGVCLMAMGGLAFVSPAAWGTLFMAAGFGGLHIGFGWVIARHYGG